MALSRRGFVQAVGMGSATALTGAWIGARGREDRIWSAFEPTLEAVEPGKICLSSNENPLGPGKTVMKAVRAAFGDGGRAPGRYSSSGGDLIDAIAKKLGVKPDNIVLGCGSTQILRTVTHLFTAKDKALVGTIPTYEECAGYAEMMGYPVRAVSLDADFKMDLGKFADAAKGAASSSTAIPAIQPRPTSARKPRATFWRRSTASHQRRRSWWTKPISTTSPTPITTRISPSPSRIRASSWPGPSRRRMAWPACGWVRRRSCRHH